METTDQPTLPPHRTLSPGFSGDEVILDEVALITDKREEAALAGDSGNHSSEEELEEINTKKSQYVERDCKRKWTDLSQSDTSCDSDTEFEEPELGLEVGSDWGGEVGDVILSLSAVRQPRGEKNQYLRREQLQSDA